MPRIRKQFSDREEFIEYVKRRFDEDYDSLRGIDAYQELRWLVQRYEEGKPTEVVPHTSIAALFSSMSEFYADIFEDWGLLRTEEIEMKGFPFNRRARFAYATELGIQYTK